jgi:hypothetical protein
MRVSCNSAGVTNVTHSAKIPEIVKFPTSNAGRDNLASVPGGIDSTQYERIGSGILLFVLQTLFPTFRFPSLMTIDQFS